MTLTPPDFEGLAERLTEARQPSRGLDIAVWRLADRPPGVACIDEWAPPFSSSLDAIWAQIPSGWYVTTLTRYRNVGTGRLASRWYAGINPEHYIEPHYWWTASGANPALALCGAVVRAWWSIRAPASSPVPYQAPR